MSKWDAVILNEKDQIATALKTLNSGDPVRVNSAGTVLDMVVKEEIPLCHKFAVVDIATGTAVHKYGEPIGAASNDIEIGHHVHIHNLKSLRAKNK